MLNAITLPRGQPPCNADAHGRSIPDDLPSAHRSERPSPGRPAVADSEKMRLAGGGGVALTFQQRRFLSDAPDAVSLKNWATLRLDPGDNSFTAGFRFEARLPDGGMLRTGRVTACGTRVVAEPA